MYIKKGCYVKRVGLGRGMNYYIVFTWNRWWIFGECGVGRVKIHWIIGFSVRAAARRCTISNTTPVTNSLSKCTAYFSRLFGQRRNGVETERSNVYLISPLKFYSARIPGTPALFTMLVLRSCVSIFSAQSDTDAKVASPT